MKGVGRLLNACTDLTSLRLHPTDDIISAESLPLPLLRAGRLRSLSLRHNNKASDRTPQLQVRQSLPCVSWMWAAFTVQCSFFS